MGGTLLKAIAAAYRYPQQLTYRCGTDSLWHVFWRIYWRYKVISKVHLDGNNNNKCLRYAPKRRIENELIYSNGRIIIRYAKLCFWQKSILTRRKIYQWALIALIVAREKWVAKSWNRDKKKHYKESFNCMVGRVT